MKFKLRKNANLSLKDEWDYQKAYYLLNMQGIDGKTLTYEQAKELEKKVTLFLWENVKKQFPQIEKFLTNKRGGFNKISKDDYNTPIINIHGHFYMQLISQNNKYNWVWESIDLEPYRFFFNEEGYFKGLVRKAINNSIMKGLSKKEHYEKLITALNNVDTYKTDILLDTETMEVTLDKNKEVLI